MIEVKILEQIQCQLRRARLNRIDRDEASPPMAAKRLYPRKPLHSSLLANLLDHAKIGLADGTNSGEIQDASAQRIYTMRTVPESVDCRWHPHGDDNSRSATTQQSFGSTAVLILKGKARSKHLFQKCLEESRHGAKP